MKHLLNGDIPAHGRVQQQYTAAFYSSKWNYSMYKITGESIKTLPLIRIFLTKFKEKEIRAPLRTLGLVGVTGLEPAASWSQTKRATKLRYTPFIICCINSFAYTTGCIIYQKYKFRNIILCLIYYY